MRKSMPIFFSALLLTGVNLLLRLVSTSFQVYLSGRIGAAGIGLLQLVLSVGSLSMTAGMAGIRTATMYLSAEEIGKKRSVTRVLSGCFLYSLLCSCTVGLIVWVSAPFLAFNWIGHPLFNDERYDGSEIRKGTIYAKYRQFIENCFRLLPRQALHAKTLGFVHPRSGEMVRFDSRLPEDMQSLIDKWRRYSENMAQFLEE